MGRTHRSRLRRRDDTAIGRVESLARVHIALPAQPPTTMLVNKGPRLTRGTHELCESTDRITLADIQKLEDGCTTWLELVQFEWIVRQPNPGLRACIADRTYVRVGTKEPLSLSRISEGGKQGTRTINTPMGQTTRRNHWQQQ